MSRLGKKPVEIPKGVEVKIDNGLIEVKGPKGTLSKKLNPFVKIENKDGKLFFSVQGNDKKLKALHGLTRVLVANMVEGVTKGFEKRLEISGVGYRALKEGKTLVLQIGYSNPVKIDIVPGIDVSVEGANKITVSGIDKELVGQFSAKIKEIRPVEPYKGKGIKYVGEYVRRKAGKAAKAAGAAGA